MKKKTPLSHTERIAVTELMDTLATYIRLKPYNKTDTILYRELQGLLNKNFDIELSNL